MTNLKTILTIATTAVMMMTSFVFANTLSISPTNNTQTIPFVARIQGNSTSPYEYSTFPPSTLITTSLWNLRYGRGNTTMEIYENSSIHTISRYTNIKTYTDTVVGYPSVQFFHNQLIPTSAFNKNYSSYTSFDFVGTTLLLPVDCAYDIWFTNNTTNLHPNAEVMIWLYWSVALEQTTSQSHVSIPTIVNGVMEDLTWYVEKEYCDNHNYPTYVFIPSLLPLPRMSYGIQLSTFISDIQHLGADLNHSYVKSIDIGTEFGSPFFQTEYCSVWFNSYLVVNGQKETILGDS